MILTSLSDGMKTMTKKTSDVQFLRRRIEKLEKQLDFTSDFLAVTAKQLLKVSYAAESLIAEFAAFKKDVTKWQEQHLDDLEHKDHDLSDEDIEEIIKETQP